MRSGHCTAIAAVSGVISLLLAGQAEANITVLGGGMAESCSVAAKVAAKSRKPRTDSLEICTLALERELLEGYDLAGTYVNRGVIHLTRQEYPQAQRDFEAAIRIMPDLGEAYVNRGAALIGQGREAEGIADIDKGLTLAPSEPEKAYFNRGLAKERLNDLKGAYLDFRKAQELKPDWEMPSAELSRFTVVQR